MKTSTRPCLILLLFVAVNCSGLAPRIYAQARPPGRAKSAENPLGSIIRGRVVYADTGTPVRRAEVTLTNAATGERVGGTATGVRGDFTFRGVPAGRYTLAAAAPSLADTDVVHSSDDDTALLNLAEAQSCLTEVEVGATKDADVLVRAARGGAITGRVTSDDGEPVSGAQVRLFRLSRGRLSRVASTWGTLPEEKRRLETDSRGVYRVGGLPAGDYVVRASESDLGRWAGGDEGDGYGDGSLVVTYYPSAVSLKDAVLVRVYEGRDTGGIDVRLPDRPTRKIGGTVTLKRGLLPVAGAEITISRKDEGLSPRRGFGEESARTDEDGRWEVFGVPDGEYVLTVSSVISLISRGPGGVRDVRIVPTSKELIVAGSDLTDLRMEVEEGGRVGGIATVEGGRQFPELLRIDAIRDGEEVDFTYVREGGRFELDRVPAGEIRLRVAGFPEDRYYLKSLTVNGTDLTREPLRLGERAAVEGVSVVLSTDVARLKGQALSRRDGTSPVAHAVVALVPTDERVRRSSGGPRIVRADAAGRFEIACGPGEYFVVALTEQSALKQRVRVDEEYVSRHRQSLTRVTLRAGETVASVKVVSIDEE